MDESMDKLVQEMRRLGVKSVSYTSDFSGQLRTIQSLELFEREPLPPLPEDFTGERPTDKPPAPEYGVGFQRAIDIYGGKLPSKGEG